MNANANRRIAASVRDDALSVAIGAMPAARFLTNYDDAVALGITIDPQVVVFAESKRVPVVAGHEFAHPTEDVPEVCSCGAEFTWGDELQAVKVAHLEHFAAVAAR